MSADYLSIALDAMGGDHGPKVVVPAALAAIQEVANLKIYLVGNPDAIYPYLKGASTEQLNSLEVIPAEQEVAMDESPTHALRHKKNSSMALALRLVKEGQAQACVSAGNTGALVVIARYILKMLPGISRPAIIRALPSLEGEVFVLDLGANVDCPPEQLVQFAHMGSALAQAVTQQASPSVGLLNIGSELIKGNDSVKKTNTLLTESAHLNYLGYVEGNDIYKGTAQVVVCDGFVGNVVLKASEGLAQMILSLLKTTFTSSWPARLWAFIAKPLFKKLHQHFNPDRYNGASLLGLMGIVIKSHGGSDTQAFKQAILVAVREALSDVPAQIKAKLSEQNIL